MALVGDRLNSAALWIAVAMGVSIPISTALDNLLLAALVLCWAAGGRVREKWAAIRGNAFALAAGAFFLLHVAASTYSLGSAYEVWHALDKASTVLLIPILISLQPSALWRQRALGAFLAAMVLTLALSFPVWLDVMPALEFIKGHPLDAVVFKKKIGHSVLMAFAAFAFALAARNGAGTKQRALLGLVAALAAFNVLFMVWGRTGQLVLMGLLLYFLVASYGWRGLLASAAAGLAIGGTAYLVPSSALHVRTLDTIEEIRDWRAGKPADISNMRLEQWTNSLRALGQRPVLGVGTGGFAAAYAEQIAGTSMMATEHSENQYLLTAVQLGAVGLVALLALFAAQWRLAGRLASRTEIDLARGLVILMLIGCMFASFLNDHTHAFFYAWLSGLLFGGARSQASGQQVPEAGLLR